VTSGSCTCASARADLLAKLLIEQRLAPGDERTFVIPPDKLHLFDGETGQAIREDGALSGSAFMLARPMALTVLAGSDFCISDDRGDVREGALGFFARDTRHLARFVLTLDEVVPQLLSCRHDVPHRATFFLRNALTEGLRHDELLVVRERRVAVGLLEDVTIRNLASEPKRFSVGLELEVDFADIFSVKERDMQFGDPLRARPLPTPVPGHPSDDGTALVFGDPDDAELRTHVFLSRPRARAPACGGRSSSSPGRSGGSRSTSSRARSSPRPARPKHGAS
jgi:hypothetical protein